VKNRAVLRVRHYGPGIARATLDHFLKDGTHLGVALAGMQERVREQGGTFEIRSDQSGTAIEVNMPLSDVTRFAERQAPTTMN
jgi:signal transduction histidine kinase